MSNDYKTHLANQNDTATIARHRILMFHEMGCVSDHEREALWDPTLSWIRQELDEGRYFGWLAEVQGQVVAGAGILLRSLPPGPNCMKVGKWGHIANVYA